MGILDAVLGSSETTGSAGIWPFLLGWGRQKNIASFPRVYRPPSTYSPAVTSYPKNMPVTPTQTPSVYSSGGGNNLGNYSFNYGQPAPQTAPFSLPPDIQKLYDTDPAVRQYWTEMSQNQPLADYWASQAASPDRTEYWRALGAALSSGAPMPSQTAENFDASEYIKSRPGVTLEGAYADWQAKNPSGGNFPYLPSLVPGMGSGPQPSASQAAAQPSPSQAAMQPSASQADYGISPEIAQMIATDPAVAEFWSQLAADPTLASRLQSGQTSGGQSSGQLSPTSSGGANNMGNYYFDFEKNNTIPTAPDKNANIPGAYPSIANEILNGPPEYYPWLDIAPKSTGQQKADDLLQLWTDMTGGGQGALAEQTQAAQAQRALAAQMGGLNIDPTFNIERSANGLSDFLNPYTASPNLDQVLNAAAGDSARYMNEMLLPKDRASAISGGQYGGSRSGIAEGITRRGVGEEIAQMDYNTRYADYQNYLANKLAAGGQILQGDIGLANAATNRWKSMADARRDAMATASDIYGSSAQANNAAWNQGMDLNDVIYKRGMMDQLLQQGIIDSDKARWDYGQQAPMAWLERYIQALQGAPATPATRTDMTPGALDYAVALFGGGENSLASGIKSIFS